MWIFVNALIENPTFDSQTKETMTLLSSKFGSKPTLSEEFMKKGEICSIIDSTRSLSWLSVQVVYCGERVELGKV
jgi:DNA topoisomerase-2